MSPFSSPITTRPAQVQFARDFVQPPSELYITPEDRLYARATSSIASEPFQVSGRILTPDGEVRRFTFRGVNLATVRFPNQISWVLTEGFLLGVGAAATGSTDSVGQTFIELGLLRGGEDMTALATPLCSGYVTPQHRIGWPPGRIMDSSEGPGYVYTFPGTTPAAGNEINEVVPLGAQWRVRELFFRFVTAAAVANRYVTVQYVWPGGTTMFSGANLPQAANLTRYYSAFEGIRPMQAYNTGIMTALPFQGMLKQDWRIRTGTVNLQAGDQYDLIAIKVEEWLSFL